MEQNYRIQPIAIPGFAPADGVYVNREGAWLGMVDLQGEKLTVMPYADEGDYVPAPAGWRDRIIESLD